jgi:DNA polymerase-4
MAGPAQTRCPACHRPRLIRHPELDTLSIAHLDCDAFYAAVEKRDDPSLADRPVIIGGGHRGVVSTACYLARTFGVKSAMPMVTALRLCPDAVVLRPNMAKYSAVGRTIRAMMQSLTPLVEPLSLDEAFLDLSGTERLHKSSPAETMAQFVRRVESEVGITVSVGLSYCKFLAKIASDLDKPRGFAVIGRAEALDFLAEKSVSLIWGVGKAMTERLERDGIKRIKDIRALDESYLTARYGEIGRRLYGLSFARDSRHVAHRRETKSISAETTFAIDMHDAQKLSDALWPLCETVARRAKADGLEGCAIHLKLKTSAFKTRTLSRRLSDPTQLADVLFRHGADLLRQAIDGTDYRLIGIGLAALSPSLTHDAQDLIDRAANERARAERAMDKVRAKFGTGAIGKGRGR